jgi:2TM domain
MENTNYTQEQYQQAKKKVEEIKGFYSHLTSYILVIAFLIFINLRYSPKHLWFFWPAFGWGIGLLFHAIGTFDIIPFFGKNWEQRKIDELMKKNENK